MNSAPADIGSACADPGAPSSSAAVFTALRELLVTSAQLRNRLATELGLRESEVIALNYLDLWGELQPRDLAKHVALTSGGVTGLVDRLEQAGYLSRRPHPTDRRSILVATTELGRSAVSRYYSSYLGGLNDLLNETVDGERIGDLLVGQAPSAAPLPAARVDFLPGIRVQRA